MTHRGFPGEDDWSGELERRLDRDNEHEPVQFHRQRPTRLEVMSRQLSALAAGRKER